MILLGSVCGLPGACGTPVPNEDAFVVPSLSPHASQSEVVRFQQDVTAATRENRISNGDIVALMDLLDHPDVQVGTFVVVSLGQFRRDLSWLPAETHQAIVDRLVIVLEEHSDLRATIAADALIDAGDAASPRVLKSLQVVASRDDRVRDAMLRERIPLDGSGG